MIACGILILFLRTRTEKCLKSFSRSKKATYILMGVVMLWFSLKLNNLGPADFGEYKSILMIIFWLICLSSFFLVPDFLGVRALAGLTLLICNVLLNAAFMQDPSSRLFLVGFIYLAILFVFMLGVSPYIYRDIINWLFEKSIRTRLFGYSICIYGSLLTYVALNY